MSAVKEVLLIDLSSIAHPFYHVSASDPDPDATSIRTIAKVRALASGRDHVAICSDAPGSFRREIDPTYKAQRKSDDGAAIIHQITLAEETLRGDGFPIWKMPGFEADDLIGTATKLSLEAGLDVLIASQDKDLTQLVGDHVKIKSTRDGAIWDAATVKAKFGVEPAQMGDYLSLAGDASDNVKGANGIGAKKAAAILAKHGTLDNLYANAKEVGWLEVGVSPSEASSLQEFEGRYPTVRRLIALRDDVPIQFSEVMGERVSKDASTFAEEEPMETIQTSAESEEQLRAASIMLPAQTVTEAAKVDIPQPQSPEAVRAPGAALAAREPGVIDAVPVEWERQLDPRSSREARIVAEDLFKSRLLSDYGSPQAVFSTMMAGRELGLPAMASLRSIQIVKGKHGLSAALMAGLVLKSGLAEYFRVITGDDGKMDVDEKHATFETLRKGPGNKRVEYTHRIEDAVAAQLVKADSGWVKNPKAMLFARACSTLAKAIYPDLLAGLYTPEELNEMADV